MQYRFGAGYAQMLTLPVHLRYARLLLGFVLLRFVILIAPIVCASLITMENVNIIFMLFVIHLSYYYFLVTVVNQESNILRNDNNNL